MLSLPTFSTLDPKLKRIFDDISDKAISGRVDPFYVSDSKKVGIMAANPKYTLDVTGTLWVDSTSYLNKTYVLGGLIVGNGLSVATDAVVSGLLSAGRILACDIQTSTSSCVMVDSGNGHGSVATKIRRFSNSRISGDNISYLDNASNGATFTINRSGVYCIEFNDYLTSGSGFIAITVNDTATTTAASTMTIAQGKRASVSTPAANVSGSCSCSLVLNVGDVIRAHTDGAQDATDTNVFFILTRVR